MVLTDDVFSFRATALPSDLPASDNRSVQPKHPRQAHSFDVAGSLCDQRASRPTQAMLRRWPEALEYRSAVLPEDGARRHLGWRTTLTLLTLDDGAQVAISERYPAWWPTWPLRREDVLLVATSEVLS